jgi:hypothetical protein
MLTLAWMSVEATVALGAAWKSEALFFWDLGATAPLNYFRRPLSFGDFRSESDSVESERLAARVAGGLLFVVAASAIVRSGLSLLGYREPQPSTVGIILLIVAAIGMPWLA